MKKFLALVIAAVMCISIFTFNAHPYETIAQATVNENDIPVMNLNIEPIAQSVNLEGINATSIKQTDVTEYYKNQDSITNLLSTAAPAPMGTTWAKRYGGSGDDDGDEEAKSIQQTSDGGYIVAGYTDPPGAVYRDFLVIKLVANGTVSWAKTYGGSRVDDASSIQQTSDGGYIVAGYTSSFGAGDYDLLVIKLGANGTVSWAKTYGGSNYDDAYSIQQTSDGGYIVAGYTSSFGEGGDFLVIKLDVSGAVSWAKTYGGSGGDYWASSIQQTSDGGYIVAGSTGFFGALGDFLVIKLKVDGTVSWAKTYGGSNGYDSAYSIQQTSDGGYIVAGETNSFGAGNADILIIKLVANGTVSWTKTYGGSSGDDWASSIQQTSDGYIVAGYTDSFGAGNADILIIKLVANGTVSWAKTYGGSSGDDWASSIQQTSDGYIVAGSTDSFGAGDYDFLVIKLNSNGEIGGDCNYLKSCSPAVASPTVTVTDRTLSTTSISGLGATASVTTNSPTIQPITICVVVTFNYNYAGATEPYATRSTAYDTPLGSNMPLDPTRTGYTFASWNTMADGTGDTFTSSTVVTSDITVYAQWTINAYTVTFNYNYAGATEPYATRSTNYNTSLGSNMPLDPTRTGYTFAGWNTKANGTGAEFTSSTVVTADITVYAQWATNIYTVTFNYNYTGSPTEPYTTRSTTYNTPLGANMPANPTRTGYTFASWNTKADGTGDTFTNSTVVTSDITVYAQWTINAYTVTFNYNYAGATEPYATKSTAYNTSLGSNMPANPTRTGYTFASWNTKADGTGDTFTNSTPVTADITVYAQWTINTYTITASAGPGGTITPSGAVVVNYGADQAFTITPNTGYHILDVKVDGASVGPVSTYTFTNVIAAHTIAASFSIDTNTITASAGPGGTITPSGAVVVNYGADQAFTITPDLHYHVADVLVDGVSVLDELVDNKYTFENVDTNHTIDAYFEHNYFKTTYPVDTEVFSPTGTINVTWDVEGFAGTEGKIRILFYNGLTWEIVASNLDLADGSYDLDLAGKTISDPLRCRVRVGAYDPATSAWLTWGTNGQYYDESGHFWIVDTSPTKYFKTTAPICSEVFSPTDTINVTWDVEGFAGTEGRIRVLFYNGLTWEIVASNLDLSDGSYDLDLTGKTISDPLRCKVRAGIYDPNTGLWLTWGTNGQYYDESGHFWVILHQYPPA